MAGMGFDEVSCVVYEEEPEPPRRPHRLRRTAVVATATALGLGALVSGASAVTSSPLTAQKERHIVRSTQFTHHHGPCHWMGGSSAGY
jgi:hypothetical protein